MKYTVVIEQAVPETVLENLQQLLSERFHLNAEQARKLAGRRGGRLMKPTDRERASVLLGIFQEVGAQVRLETLSDEGEAVAEPVTLPGVAERSPVLVISPPPAQISRDAALPDLSATEFGQVAARASGGLAATLPLEPESASGGVASTLTPAGDDFWAELAAPAPLPLPSDSPGGLLSSLHGEAQAGSSAIDDFFGSSAAPATASDTSPSHAAEVPPADIWSDFTGALTITDTLSVPAAAREEIPDLMMQGGQDVSMGRRKPLSNRLTLASVVPLGVYTALSLLTLSVVLTASQRQQVSSSAATVAAAVGAVLNTTDQNTVQQQLATLLGRDTVGFVQVEFPDGTSFFRSRTPGLDSALNEGVSTWIKAHPVSGVFVQDKTPAALYKSQLALLSEMGAGNSPQAQSLKAATLNPDNQRIDNRNFQVERISVYVKPDGSRQTLPADVKSSNTLLYRIAVGVPVDAAQAQLRNTLLILLVAGLLAALIGVMLAARAARRIVEPIERLVRAANAISLGDLSQPVRPDTNDEMGDLAQALERMRLSLDAAMNRLRKRRKA